MFEESGRIVGNDSREAELEAAADPARVIGGPDNDAEVSLGRLLHQFACGERVMQRDLVGTGFLCKVQKVLVFAEDVLYLRREEGRGAHARAEPFDIGDRVELEAFDDDLREEFRIADHIVMLDSGKVLLSGVTEDFMNSEIELVRRFVDKGMK